MEILMCGTSQRGRLGLVWGRRSFHRFDGRTSHLHLRPHFENHELCTSLVDFSGFFFSSEEGGTSLRETHHGWRTVRT